MLELLLLIIIFIFLYNYDIKYLLLFFFIFIFLIMNKDKNNNNNNNKNKSIYILNIISNLDKHKHININDYKIGIKYWYLFYNNISDINNTNQYDKYKIYLNKCVDHLNYLYLVNNDDEYKSNINKLYMYGLNLLKNKKKDLNENWENNPDKTMKQLIFNEPLAYNISFNR